MDLDPLDEGKPGTNTTGGLTVTVPDGPDAGTAPDPVGGVPVTLTVDGSAYFTNGGLADRGQTITVFTDVNGRADYTISIGSSPEFNDDGLAIDTVTARAGNTDTTPYRTNTADPVTAGSVQVVPNEALSSASTDLPDAKVGDIVYFDVYTLDGFGNRVGDETVSVTDNTGNAGFQVCADGPQSQGQECEVPDPDENQTQSDFEADGDFFAFAQAPVMQRLTGTWNYGAQSRSDSYTINWTDGSIANSTVTIDQSPDGDQPVGTTVTETVTAMDSAGNPIQGAQVTFRRQGPSGQDDTFVTQTDNAGEATYTFVGTAPGTANIVATVTDGTSTKTVSDSVTFTAEAVEKPVVTITSSPEGEVRTGSSVTETITAKDDEGNNLPGLAVRVTRQGPDGQSDTFNTVTDSNGQATYTFFGTVAGTANITATVTNGNESTTETDQVTFVGGGGTGGPDEIVATLGGKGRGPARDVLKVSTSPNAEVGANVDFFRVGRNNRRRLVGTDSINDRGRAGVLVRDPNRRKVSKYIAIVRRTETTKGDRTNFKRLR